MSLDTAEKQKLIQIISQGSQVLSEVDDLKTGLRDTVKAIAEELELKPALINKAISVAHKGNYQNIADLAANAVDGRKQIDIAFPEEDKFSILKEKRSVQRGPSAFLTVQEGCDKFCAFCVVPYTRGAENSRPVFQILDEAKHLVECGVREITLLGQNVNAYHGAGLDGKEWSLARLIWELDKIDGLARIRFTTSHPNDMTDDLIEAHGTCKKLMPYLHLPVQSGSN